jgi:hypothetical protein
VKRKGTSAKEAEEAAAKKKEEEEVARKQKAFEENASKRAAERAARLAALEKSAPAAAAADPADQLPAINNKLLSYPPQTISTLPKTTLEAIWNYYADYERSVSLKGEKLDPNNKPPLADSFTEKSPGLRLLSQHICDAIMDMFRTALEAKQAEAKADKARVRSKHS